MAGDFNANIMLPSNNPGKGFLDMLETANLKGPTNIEPTRITASTSLCLDVVAASTEISFQVYKILDIAVSDHLPVHVDMILEGSRTKLEPIHRRSYKYTDMQELGDRIKSIKVDPESEDIDQAVEKWYVEIGVILDELAQVRMLPMRKQRSPVVTPEIKNRMQQRDRLMRRARGSKLTNIEWQQLRKLKREVTSKIRRVTKLKGREALQSNDMSRAWKFIRQISFSTKDSQPKPCRSHRSKRLLWGTS